MRLGVLPVKVSSLLYVSVCSMVAQGTKGQDTSFVGCRGCQSYRPAVHCLRRPFLIVEVKFLVDHADQLYRVVVHPRCLVEEELRLVIPAVLTAG